MRKARPAGGKDETMKKLISLLLITAVLLGSFVFALPAGALVKEDLPTDGTPVEFVLETMKQDEKRLGLSLSRQGIVTLTVTTDTPSLTMELSPASDRTYYKYLPEIQDKDFIGKTTVTKTYTLYLAADDYELTLQHLGDAANIRVSATFKAVVSDNTVNFPANKNVRYFLGEWEELTAYRVVVKKNYRLSFTLNHNFNIGFVITDDSEKIYCAKEFSAANYKAKNETVNICLTKGTYYIGLVNMAEDFEWGSGSGYLKMQVKPYIYAPTGLKVITRKTTSQTVTYQAQKGVAGYQVQCSDGYTSWAQTKTGTSLTCSFKGLQPGGKYKFRVRSYVVENGVKVFGAWSKTLCSCAKPNTPVIHTAMGGKKSAFIGVDWERKGVLAGYQIVYAYDSAFKSVAKKTNVKPESRNVPSQLYTQNGLISGRTYYVRAREYNVFNGVTYYGAWSNAKKVKVN